MTALLVIIFAVALVLIALVVSSALAARRRHALRAQEAMRQLDAAALNRQPDDLAHQDALNAKYSAERQTEDDIQAAILGPRGVPGEPSPSRMTPQRAKKTPLHLEPGHTA